LSTSTSTRKVRLAELIAPEVRATAPCKGLPGAAKGQGCRYTGLHVLCVDLRNVDEDPQLVRLRQMEQFHLRPPALPESISAPTSTLRAVTTPAKGATTRS